MPRRRRVALLVLFLALAAGGLLLRPRPVATAAELATWPWPAVAETTLHRGVTRRQAEARDGTAVLLVTFDRGVNPALTLGLWDQDAHDAEPFDNRVLEQAGTPADVVAAVPGTLAVWNGSFFNPQVAGEPPGTRAHIAPVVLDGQAHYNVGNHRWTFGAATVAGRQVLRVEYLPAYESLAERFDLAAGGVQGVVRDGRPLRLRPGATRDEPRSRSAAEAGANPGADEVATSRTSVGWSADSRVVELLLVRQGGVPGAGWTLADVQRFWLAHGIRNAVNLDGGPQAQALLREPDGWLLLPTDGGPSRRLGPELKDMPAGGTIMSFYIHDRGQVLRGSE